MREVIYGMFYGNMLIDSLYMTKQDIQFMYQSVTLNACSASGFCCVRRPRIRFARSNRNPETETRRRRHTNVLVFVSGVFGEGRRSYDGPHVWESLDARALLCATRSIFTICKKTEHTNHNPPHTHTQLLCAHICMDIMSLLSSVRCL